MKARPDARGRLDMKRYDWSKARRGRFRDRFLSARPSPLSVRILDEDLEAAFLDSESVNAALRALVHAARAAPLKRALKRAKRRAAA